MQRLRAVAIAGCAGLCVVIALAAFAIFGGGQRVYDFAPEKAPDATPAQTVYVTENGGKFHREECGSISGSQNLTGMRRTEAVENGFQACKLCKP